MPPSPSAQESSYLLALQADVQPAKYALEDEVCTMGRSSACQIVVNRKVISRLHAKIERAGARYILSDTNSANGTFVNHRRIEEAHLLEDGDQIGLGTAEVLLRFNDPDATERIAGRLHYVEPNATFLLEQQPLSLTMHEFLLLHHLYQHAGDICTHESCYLAVWHEAYEPKRDKELLDRVVSNLRGKLRRIDPTADKLIATRRNLGYVLVL